MQEARMAGLPWEASISSLQKIALLDKKFDVVSPNRSTIGSYEIFDHLFQFWQIRPKYC